MPPEVVKLLQSAVAMAAIFIAYKYLSRRARAPTRAQARNSAKLFSLGRWLSLFGAPVFFEKLFPTFSVARFCPFVGQVLGRRLGNRSQVGVYVVYVV
jgi:hypothetical protein